MPISYSLYELNEYIKRVIALNFAEPIWVNCEIAQVKEVRGNVYLDLVYHDEKTNEITAQISANIWYKTFLFLKNKLGVLLPSLLKDGTQVMLKVQVEFSERYGIKLIIEDIDPSFTIGQMEMNRQKILQKLHDEGMVHLNKMITMPSVIQKIAVISAETAAGYIDFKNHLQQNIYGYQFKITLFQAALQGQNTEREVCKALEEINSKSHLFDVIVIIRGGGSKLDLAWFDNFNIGAGISKSILPVIAGIGHDIDFTVADTVAHTSLKTPTAVADYLINHLLDFENKINETLHWIVQLSKTRLRQYELTLNQTTDMISLLPVEIIRQHMFTIHHISSQANTYVLHHLRKQHEYLSHAQIQINLLNPKNLLLRGYSIIRQQEKIIKRSAEIDINAPFDIEFYDKTIKINRK
jgi:exodeoxyribonuclease VII large subunit